MNNNENEDGIIVSDTYGQYYRPVPRKLPLGQILIIFILISIVFLIMWFSGLLTPRDREAEYNEIVDNICKAAVTYTERPSNFGELPGIETPGSTIYIRIRDLVDSYLIGSIVKDPRTNENIPLTTYIKLTVTTKYHTLCEGLVSEEKMPK